MNITRTFDFLYHQLKNAPLEKSFGSRVNGGWKFYSTHEMVELSRQLGHGLLSTGIQKGDKVSIVAYQNIPEYVILDMALAQIGVISIPVYPTISSQEYAFIFDQAEVKVCFVGDGDLYDKVKETGLQLGRPLLIYSFFDEPRCESWKSLLLQADEEEFNKTIAQIDPSDLATIIYTSGTTGQPKGVMLSHYNIISNVLPLSQRIPVPANARTLSFLPLCHIFERVATLAYMYNSAQVYFTGTDNLGGDEGDLKKVQPVFFTAVPRLLEKVYDKIYNKGLSLPLPLKLIFFWAIRLTDRFEYDGKLSFWQQLQFKIADKLVFKKWREALGGNVQGIAVGSAPCPVKVIRAFCAAGIPVREAYGLTEAAPGISVNGFEYNAAKLGTVGRLLQDVEVLILDDNDQITDGEGELIMSGPNRMLGYYKNQEATDQVTFHVNGKDWLRTGDIGRFVYKDKGIPFLKITDRKKELLKTSGGKYVAPAPIESKLKEEPLIEQVMIIGDQQRFVSALIVPSFETLVSWCARKAIPYTTNVEAIKNPIVLARYERMINEINESLSQVEKIKKFKLLAAPWEMTKSDGTAGELTPTMKLKRRVVLQNHASEITEMYK